MLIQDERPQTFQAMQGVAEQTAVLRAAIRQRTTAPRSYVLAGEYGTGKCVSGDTWITTSTGIQQLRSLFPPSLPASQTFLPLPEQLFPLQVSVGGKRETISALYYEGVRDDALRLTCDNGVTLTGSRQHPVCVEYDTGRRWVPLQDLLPGDCLVQEYDYLSYARQVSPLLSALFHRAESWGRRVAQGERLLITELQCSECEGFFEGVVQELQGKSLNESPVFEDSLFQLILTLARAFGCPVESRGGQLCFLDEMSFDDPAVTAVVKIETVTAELFDLTNPESHSYLANGLLSHNTTAARIFSQALNCETHSGDTCQTCSSCQTSPALVEYDSASMGSIDHIRQIRDDLMYGVSQRYRTVIFDECHLLSPQAQSALLPVLEGVSNRTFFLFPTTHPEKLLPTLRSRSVEIAFPLLSDEAISHLLSALAVRHERTLTEQDIRYIVRRAQGHARDAVGLFDRFLLMSQDTAVTLPALLDDLLLAYIADPNEDRLLEIMQHPLHHIQSDLGYVMKQLTYRKYVKREALVDFDDLFAKYLTYHANLGTDATMYCFLAMRLHIKNKASETPQKQKFGRR